MLLTAVAVMATDYTDKLSVTNNISGNVPEDYAITKTLDAQTISVEEGTDGVYTFTLDLRSDPDVSEILVFAAPVTENADGTISFACEKDTFDCVARRRNCGAGCAKRDCDAGSDRADLRYALHDY